MRVLANELIPILRVEEINRETDGYWRALGYNRERNISSDERGMAVPTARARVEAMERSTFCAAGCFFAPSSLTQSIDETYGLVLKEGETLNHTSPRSAARQLLTNTPE